MSFLNKIFSPNASEQKWSKIILWWEFRRIPYNILLLLLLYINYLVIDILPVGNRFATLVAGPMLVVGIFLTIVLYFTFANFCYSLGWMVQLIIKKINKPLLKKLTPKLFILGIILTIIITLSPILLEIINLIIGRLIN